MAILWVMILWVMILWAAVWDREASGRATWYRSLGIGILRERAEEPAYSALGHQPFSTSEYCVTRARGKWLPTRGKDRVSCLGARVDQPAVSALCLRIWGD